MKDGLINEWEYYTTFLEARMSETDTWSEAMIPDEDHPKYSPYAIMPELNRLGRKGWELVHIEPVIVGKNHDVLVHPNNMVYWGNTYFCVFKRAVG
ncbi:MAG: DUF4177 domain-containing protein [Anaerolineae bacterium]|nr:DUF4177 domain-containing protein [Anaerolineae bacterium]MCO5190323.1 DUF4177 domain-containing protein [Anaerolineae bacterium]MCO5196076.1 DUF4177 domain-containing protein [Anaerolineae bacterium]MCO5196891.1 DUF4177 domain-containing protein [Anaerolineae bacterium]MCO5204261.1 DUF4177 domain-containing protein [Anaerolineae bacterium]